MPRIVETTVYELGELSGAAKDRARAWYRDHCVEHDWHEFVYHDFETVCGLLGVTLKTRPVPLMGGGTRDKPCLWYRGYAANRNMPRSPLKALMSRTVVSALSAYSQSFEERQECVSGPVSTAWRLNWLCPFQDLFL